MVLQTWIFFFWFEKSGWPEKRWVYTINPHFFQVGEKWFCKLGFFFWFEKSGWPEIKIRVWRTTFLEPLFYTFLEKWLQIKWLSWRLALQCRTNFCEWLLKILKCFIETPKPWALWYPINFQSPSIMKFKNCGFAFSIVANGQSSVHVCR